MAYRRYEVSPTAAPPARVEDERTAETRVVKETEEHALVTLLPSHEDCTSPALRIPWEDCVRRSKDINVLFQSPAWFDHAAATEPGKRPALAVARTAAERIIGFAPLVRGKFPLQFEIKGRSLWTSWIPSVFIYGEEALFPQTSDLYDALFGLIDEVFTDNSSICFFSLPTASFCWRYLHESKLVQERFLTYMPGGVRPYHAVDLPRSFDEYLKKFNSKKRYNLQRQLKLLEKSAGPLHFQIVQSREQVPFFLEAAKKIARQSWQFTRGMDFEDSFEEVADLADRGILRSYLLMAGEKACAYVLGYHFRDVFYYVKVGYDQAFAASSPGTGLLYLLIKDLIENTSARRLNFDYGDAAYKREFGNVHGEDATVLLLRKTLSNRLRRQAHEAYTGTIRRMKTWFSRRSTPGQ